MSSDAIIRAAVEGLDVFDFGMTVAIVAPPLTRARVAIVMWSKTVGKVATDEAIGCLRG